MVPCASRETVSVWRMATGTDRREIPVSTNLTRFLATLATDPDLLAAYLRDRDKVIREAGLSPEDVAALSGGDRATLAARLDRERSATMSPAPSSSSST